MAAGQHRCTLPQTRSNFRLRNSSTETALPSSERAAFESFLAKVVTPKYERETGILFGQTIPAGLMWDEPRRCASCRCAGGRTLSGNRSPRRQARQHHGHRQGARKVLDFGLAKLAERTGGPDAETVTADERPQTEEGSVLGTVAYMSPEQTEGKKVDARSDIFSFGSVLYEMATGRRAFQGDSKISTLSAILHKEPQPASEISPGVPLELEKIITRCLRKDPERRAQHMGDVKLALEELKEDSESGKLSASVRDAGTVRPRARSPFRLAAIAVRRSCFVSGRRTGPAALEKTSGPASL